MSKKRIVLSGVETQNKGAELMLYAILQEIERKWPDAEVYIPFYCIKQGLKYVQTPLDLRYTPYSKYVYKLHLTAILRHLRLPYHWLYFTYIVKGADWFLDGSGYGFSDVWNIKKGRVRIWGTMLKNLYNQGCKIVFLPQAFGPVEKKNTKRILKLAGDYASIVMPRESVSYDYLGKSGVINMDKVKIFTDFTSLVAGVFPSKYEKLRNGICIIPNRQMILKGAISYENYIKILLIILEEASKSGHPVYLLNHEGKKDEAIAFQCREQVGHGVEVVTGLNALQVKGLIASAYMVITSRFHGLASALNSCVPCLATSWSFKYEELYKDYGLNGCVLPIDDTVEVRKMLREYMNADANSKIRSFLESQKHCITNHAENMWKTIWNLQ